MKMNSMNDTGNVRCTIFLGFFALIIILFASSENYAFAAPPSLGDNGTAVFFPNAVSNSTLILSDVNTGSSADRLLVVSVAIDHSQSIDETITSVKFGPGPVTCTLGAALSLTLVPGTTSTSSLSFNQIYSLVDPPASEICDVTVTLTGPVGDLGSSSTSAVANYAMFSGVDQITPIDNTLTTQSNATNATPSASIVTISDHFVYDIMSTATVFVTTPTPDPSQTLFQATRIAGGSMFNDFAMGSSYQLGATDTMKWTLSDPAPWDISAIAIRSVDLSLVSSSNGSGCSGDCTPPTLGVSTSGTILVDSGFRYNDYTTNVNLFHTPFPLITINVGDENVAELKIYENSGIKDLKHVTLGFGLAKDEIISNSAAKIEIDFDYDGSHTVSVFDPENSLENIRTEIDLVNCMDTSQHQCILIKIYHTFRAPLEFNIVSTDVWDMSRNAWQNYYNHGIHIEGDSLNPPNTYDGISKGHIYHLTETGKNTAVDEFGHTWSYHHGIWNKDYVKPVQSSTSLTNPQKIFALEKLGVKNGAESFGYTKYDPEFAVYKKEQELYAQKTLNDICPRCSDDPYDKINNIVLYDDKITPQNGYGADLEELIVQEEILAQKYLDELFEKLYHSSKTPIHNFE